MAPLLADGLAFRKRSLPDSVRKPLHRQVALIVPDKTQPSDVWHSAAGTNRGPGDRVARIAAILHCTAKVLRACE
jgi:hypothetical protein